MKLNVTQKILVGYLLGFMFLLAYSGLVIFNGKKIEATTIDLSNQKLPAMIAAGQLQSGFKSQINHLYELYATTEQKIFEERWNKDLSTIDDNLNALIPQPEFKPHEEKLDSLREKQNLLTRQFVSIMRAPEIDWDEARLVLEQFSQNSDLMIAELDILVSDLNAKTLSQASTSRELTEQLMRLAIALTFMTFVGIFFMVFFAHRKIALPLREVSETLIDITSRRDLTRRLNIQSDDEIGGIAIAGNNLLAEFQRLALTLDGAAQEVSRTMHLIADVTEDTRVTMAGRNTKLRTATQDFMRNIELVTESAEHNLDPVLHRAQMKFIHTHLSEIDEGTVATTKNISVLQSSTGKLKELSDTICSQIRLLNF